MAEPLDHARVCSPCAALERRMAELERRLAAALARVDDVERRNTELTKRNSELTKRNSELTKRNAELERLLDQRTRDGKRQAAPFSKGEPKADPKTPGRKPGRDYGTQAFRRLPEGPPDQIIHVPTPKHCPTCGGTVRETHVDQQFQVEIPRRPILRQFNLHPGDYHQLT